MEKEMADLLKQKDQRTIEYFYDKYAPSIYGMIKAETPVSADHDTMLFNSFTTFFKMAESADVSKERLFVSLYKITRKLINQQGKS